jgi:hypothetical protein
MNVIRISNTVSQPFYARLENFWQIQVQIQKQLRTFYSGGRLKNTMILLPFLPLAECRIYCDAAAPSHSWTVCDKKHTSPTNCYDIRWSHRKYRVVALNAQCTKIYILYFITISSHESECNRFVVFRWTFAAKNIFL